MTIDQPLCLGRGDKRLVHRALSSTEPARPIEGTVPPSSVNTLLMQRVLDETTHAGSLTAVARRALSPLYWSHVNLYGTFQLDMECPSTSTADPCPMGSA